MWLRRLVKKAPTGGSGAQSRPAPPASGEVTAEMFNKRDKDDQMKATVTLLQVRPRDPPHPTPIGARDQAQLTLQRFKKTKDDPTEPTEC